MDFVNKLDKGLDTVVSDNGTNVSLGEKQRLGLARVILKNPGLLLLDEPTSNIDAYNEKVFLDTLIKLKKKMSIIIVTHKNQTAQIADRVYSLEEGKLKKDLVNNAKCF